MRKRLAESPIRPTGEFALVVAGVSPIYRIRCNLIDVKTLAAVIA